MRICGAKYDVWGPKTASGRPLADSAAETTSALDMLIERRLGGRSPGAARVAVAGERERAALSVLAATTPVRRSEPASAIAMPPRAGRFGGAW